MANWMKRGKQCVCIARNHVGRWKCSKSGQRIDGPQTGDRLTVLNITQLQEGVTSLEFAEWPGRYYTARWFRPMVVATVAQDLSIFAHHLQRQPVAA